MDGLVTLPDLAACVAERFTVPLFDADGLSGFACPQGAVGVDRYDEAGEALDPGAERLVMLGWTFDAPSSTALWFDLSPAGGGWLVVSENDADGAAAALVYLRGTRSGPGLAALFEALAAGMDEEGPFAPSFLAGWPTEVEAVHPDLPREALRRFVRAISPFPDPFGRETAEFEGVDEEAPDPAAVDAAFDRYLARILPAP